MRILLAVALAASLSCNGMGNNGNPGDGGAGGGDGGGGGGGEPDMTVVGSFSQDILQSGTRIKMRVLATPDGAKDFRGWFDTTLNTNCSFTLAADGMTRCLPIDFTTNPYWADSNCSQPAFQTLCGTGLPKYVDAYIVSELTCSSSGLFYKRHVYPLTMSTVTQIYVGNGGPTGCTMTTVAPGYTAYTAGAEVPASMFQSATESVQ